MRYTPQSASREMVRCKHCRTSFETYLNAANRKTFCSSACYHAHAKGGSVPLRFRRSTKTCEVCGKVFTIRRCEGGRRFCGAPCYAQFLRDKPATSHPRWKGGITVKRDIHSPQMQGWREYVFRRDGYTCQHAGCGQVGGRLHAHHLQPWASFVDLRYTPSNGQTLCEKHHREVHRGRS